MKNTLPVLSCVILASAASFAHAQATRTWVSATGDDANPCSREAPCLNFQTAISKTDAKGEVSVLNAGSFAAFSISKSITIDGNGAAVVIIANGGQRGISINAADDDVIILRNLEVRGNGNGFQGVDLVNAKQLIMENMKISGFLRSGVAVVSIGTAATNNVVISNSTITTTAGGGIGVGVRVGFGTTTVRQSVIAGNDAVGFLAEDSGVINADSNLLTGNAVAVKAGTGGTGQSAATVRLSNNDIYGNLTGFGCGGGVLASAGNNRKGGNVGGTVPTCSPSAAITVQ